jgi:hypothetical protein
MSIETGPMQVRVTGLMRPVVDQANFLIVVPRGDLLAEYRSIVIAMTSCIASHRIVLLYARRHLDPEREHKWLSYSLIVVSGLRVATRFEITEKPTPPKSLHAKERSETCKDVCETYSVSSNNNGTLGTVFTR